VRAVPEAECVFCKIFRKEIPATEIARTEHTLVFRDLMPQAPAHVLAIPRRHATHLSEFLAAADSGEVVDLLAQASAAGIALGNDGYRVVTNEGRDGGQTVPHLHLHVLAGRQMTWPPG
jgi:histidine triad (HIT) family protein